jgi:hypothetical protein
LSFESSRFGRPTLNYAEDSANLTLESYISLLLIHLFHIKSGLLWKSHDGFTGSAWRRKTGNPRVTAVRIEVFLASAVAEGVNTKGEALKDDGGLCTGNDLNLEYCRW